MNIIKEYAEWISKYDWDAHLTIRLHDIPLTHAPRQIITDVLRPLEAICGQKITALGVIVPATPAEQQHAHYVVRFTRHSPSSDELDRLKSRLLDRRSKIISHTDAVEITPYLYHKTPAYIADHMLRPGATIEHYRQNLKKELLA